MWDNPAPTIFQRTWTWGLAVPVKGVLPVNILVPEEPDTYPVSVKVMALKVVLSLVADALNSEFNALLISAKTTILAVVGIEFAVNVSDIKAFLNPSESLRYECD